MEELKAAVDSITGYDPETAKVLYAEAFAEALELGYITDADNDGKSDQTVEITYAIGTDSSFYTKLLDYLNEKMNEVTAGTPFEGKIVFKKSCNARRNPILIALSFRSYGHCIIRLRIINLNICYLICRRG